ncbi:hypothetical protein Tco_0057669 [Tanacetum coccineum]
MELKIMEVNCAHEESVYRVGRFPFQGTATMKGVGEDEDGFSARVGAAEKQIPNWTHVEWSLPLTDNLLRSLFFNPTLSHLNICIFNF